MEQNSPLESFDAQLRECYGRVVYSHKAHEKSADLLERRNGTIKLTQIILAAATTTGILVTVFGDNQVIGIVAAILSLLSLSLSSYTKKYDLGEMAQKHANTAAALWNIRELYLSLLTDIHAHALDQESIRKKRDELQAKLLSVYEGAPRSVKGAYELASKGLQKNEELTFSSTEIDLLLPSALRREAGL